MRKTITLIAIIALTSSYAFISTSTPTGDCKVLIEELAKEYTGDCKKGLAHGKGKAVGIDTYEGAFKKGFPEGEGVYTWANGDVYTGSFKKGKKVGAGKQTFADGREEQTGFWSDDEYIGQEKTPHKIINRSVSINRVAFKRKSAEPNQLDVKFTRLGKPIKCRNVTVRGSYGVVISESDFNAVIKVHSFPMQGNLSFAAMGNRDAGGRGGGEFIDGNMEFKINQAGSWEVTIEMQGGN